MPASSHPRGKTGRRAPWMTAAALLSVATHAEASGRDPRSARPASSSAALASVPDVTLVDQDGRSVRFRSDVLRDRVVVIDFVFTTCTTICPVLSSTFARLQDRLGERLAGSVQLVSISLDPVRDTPERLRALNAVVELSVPYERGDVLAALHREGEVLVEVHDDRATRVRARLPKGGVDRFRQFFPGDTPEPPGRAS